MATIPDDEWIDDEFLTIEELKIDIRRRLEMAPKIPGSETRALPPVSRKWIVCRRQRKED